MKRAHVDSALEYQRFVTRAFAVGKGANGLCAFVLVGNKEVIQTLVAKCVEKPFTMKLWVPVNLLKAVAICAILTCMARAIL